MTADWIPKDAKLKVYIAYSIKGTNCYITATKDGFDRSILTTSKEFVPFLSRRPGYDYRRDGVKLHWTKLLSQEGTPIRTPSLVLNRFRMLESEGWTLNTEEFIKRHFGKRKKSHES